MIESFEALLRQIAKTDEQIRKAEAWTVWQLKNPDWDPDVLGPRLDLLRAFPGFAKLVDEAIKRQRKRTPEPAKEQESSAYRTVDDWLYASGWADVPPLDLDVPPGWLCDATGLWRAGGREPIFVSPSPVACVGRAVDADTGTASLVLVWRYGGEWRLRTVPRASAVTRDGLLALAADGFPADQSNATDLARWLALLDARLRQPSVPALGRMGWLPDGSGYAWGSTPIGAPVVVLAPGQGEREEVERYQTAGTLAEWRSGVWARCAGYSAEIAILASLAAPLLHVVGSTGWTLDVGGPPGTGKTTCQHAAASVWGSGLLVPWPRTWAGMRSTVEFRADLPTILDDTKNAASWGQVQDLLYQVAGERSQVLGAAGGGTRAGRLVRTIVISSGESPIGDHLQDAQGAAFRILTLAGPPFPPGSGEIVPKCEEAAKVHFGHAGPALVRWLVEHRADWPGLRDKWKAHAARISAAYPGDGAGRLAPRLAMLHLAADLAESVLELRPSDDVLRAFVSHALGGVSERDVPAAALRHALGWLEARPSQVLGWHGDRLDEPILGIADGVPGLAFVATGLTEILERGGYDPSEIRRQWAERGWLARVEKGRDGRARTDARVSALGRQMRVVHVSQAALTALDKP